MTKGELISKREHHVNKVEGLGCFLKDAMLTKDLGSRVLLALGFPFYIVVKK